MKRKQINRGKKWLVAVLPPTTFVTITNQKCQLYPAPEGLSGERLTGGSRGQQDTGAPVFESHHPHEKGSYLNDRWLPFLASAPPTRTHTAPRGFPGPLVKFI